MTTLSPSGLEQAFEAESVPDAYAAALLSLVAQSMDDALA